MWIIVESLLSLILIIPVVISIPCHCSDDQCRSSVCESQWCIVGIKSTGTVVRQCVNENSKNLLNGNCHHEVEDWSEVCGCDTSMCNTFTYLRYKMQEMQLEASIISPSPFIRSANRKFLNEFFDKSSDSSSSLDERETIAADEPDKFDLASPNKQPYPPNSVIISRPELTERGKFNGKTIKPMKENHLMMVLIVVPLSVGATAVCVIVVNYYCKLC